MLVAVLGRDIPCAGAAGRTPDRSCWCPATAATPQPASARRPRCMPTARTPLVSLPDDGRGDLNAQAAALGDTVPAVLRDRRRRTSTSWATRPAGSSPGCGCAITAARRGPGGSSRSAPAPRHRLRRARRRRCARRVPDRHVGSWHPAASCSPGSTPATRLRPARSWVSIWTTHDTVVVPPRLGRTGRRAQHHGAERLPDRPCRPRRPAHRPLRRWRWCCTVLADRPGAAPGIVHAAQLLMSLVAKLAQAAPSSTTT